jgi:hypothetical protein
MHWDSLNGLKQTEALIQGPSANKTRELLKLGPLLIYLHTSLKTLNSNYFAILMHMSICKINTQVRRCSSRRSKQWGFAQR